MSDVTLTIPGWVLEAVITVALVYLAAGTVWALGCAADLADELRGLPAPVWVALVLYGVVVWPPGPPHRLIRAARRRAQARRGGYRLNRRGAR